MSDVPAEATASAEKAPEVSEKPPPRKKVRLFRILIEVIFLIVAGSAAAFWFAPEYQLRDLMSRGKIPQNIQDKILEYKPQK